MNPKPAIMDSATDRRSSGITVREPRPEDLPRVAHLLKYARCNRECRLLVAERMNPVRRFVGAVSWWNEGTSGRFQLACLPGSAQMEAAGALVNRVLVLACELGLESLQYADLLSEGHPWQTLLQQEKFERLRSERVFEIAYEDAWIRVKRLYEKHQKHMPAGWRAVRIREQRPEIIEQLIAPYRLLPMAMVHHYWHESTAEGFDLDMSCILFDDSRPFGAFLARRLKDVLFIDVQVVVEPNPKLRSLADMFQLYHSARGLPPGERIRCIQLRSGEVEHRQTANLAFRMGGRELSMRHVFERRFES